MAVSGGLHRADEGRAALRLPVEKEVAGPVGQTAVRHQRPSAAGEAAAEIPIKVPVV